MGLNCCNFMMKLEWKKGCFLWMSKESGFLRQDLDVQAGFRKGRGARDQIANIHWIIEKAREFQ